MTSRLSHTALLAAAAALSLGGCRSRRAPDEHALPPAPRPPPVVTTAEPVDEALPGELAEGTVRAFGLALPRVMAVRGRFDDVVFAAGDAPPDQVANYVRQRVTAEKIETGPEKTLFSRATVKGSPGTLIAVSVVTHNGRTEIEIRDVTPKPDRPGQSSDDRWRALGLQPDGTPLDPTQLR
ncbi:MAG: hypothetical protein QM820_17690 [Minicystis sp.]